MRTTIKRSVECSCGSDYYHRSWKGDTLSFENMPPVWRCDNCRKETPRTTRTRSSNVRKALDFVIALRKEWEPTNEAMHSLINRGLAQSGCLLVHSSTFNYHLNKLTDGVTNDKVSNWDLLYAKKEALKDFEAAKAFVAGKEAAATV